MSKMTDLVVRELSPAIGAEIAGIDPSRELDDETVAQLRRLFDDRSVLVFRDVDLAPEDQAYLAGLLVGGAAPADRGAAEANAVVYETHISNQPGGNAPYGELLFHSDMMWADAPVQLLSLYGLHVEQPSVPTVYASAVRAWDALPDDLRARVEGRTAVHVTGQQARGDAKTLLKSEHETVRSTTKPVAHRHPRTGRTMLYVSQMMTSQIEGLRVTRARRCSRSCSRTSTTRRTAGPTSGANAISSSGTTWRSSTPDPTSRPRVRSGRCAR